MELNIISEESFRETMNTVVLPALDRSRISGTFERISGETIAYEHHDAADPKAIVVIAHGFTESMLKFSEAVWYFLQNHYSVWLIEHRGHGNSCRIVDGTDKVHIDNYHDMILDLHYFVSRIVKPANTAGLPVYLYAHSMGGGIGACVLEHFPSDFKKAVLTSPMLELDPGRIPTFAAYLAASAMVRFGKAKDAMAGMGTFSEMQDFETTCCTSRARFDWYLEIQKMHPEYQTSAATWKTTIEFLRITQEAARNCEKVTAKVLLFQADDDTLVRPGGQERFIAAIPDGRLVKVRSTKHEIYRAEKPVLEGYWREIFNFFDR